MRGGKGKLDPEERFKRMEARLAETQRILLGHAKILAKHDEWLAAYDERAKLAWRELEGLQNAAPGPIRKSKPKLLGRPSS